MGVIGCGLIGGSIALSLIKSGYQVMVHDLPQSKKAILNQIPGIIFKGDIEEICRSKPGIIFICVPSDEVVEVIDKVARLADSGTIITDVAGVKQSILEAAGRIVPDGVVFVGGHPMAGSEKSGVQAAQPFLFQNAVYVLTPLKDYPVNSISPLVDVIERLGGRILFMDASEHDKIAAATSHLPQLIAVELVNLIGELSDGNEHFNTLAAGGFRDMTRIASSDFTVWKDVIGANRENIGTIMRAFIKRLSDLDSNLMLAADNKIEKEFESARYARSRIRRGGKGFLKLLYDLYVVVEDKVGVLREITSTLADAGINIKDIELLKVREGTGGMFRLSFETEQVLDRSAEILEGKGFQILRKEFEG